MIINNIKKFKFYLIFIFLLFILFFYLFINNIKEEKIKNLASKPILINLLTSVHPNLNWNFQPLNPQIIIKPGDVTTVEYIVENLGVIDTLKPVSTIVDESVVNRSVNVPI